MGSRWERQGLWTLCGRASHGKWTAATSAGWKASERALTWGQPEVGHRAKLLAVLGLSREASAWPQFPEQLRDKAGKAAWKGHSEQAWSLQARQTWCHLCIWKPQTRPPGSPAALRLSGQDPRVPLSLSLSPTLHIPGFQGTQPGPPGLPSKQLLLNSPTPSSLGSKQYNFKQRPLPQPWGKYWAGFSALLTVYFFLPTLSAKIEPEGPCLSPSPLPCPGLPGPGHGAHISQGSHECSRNVSSPKLGCSIPAPPSR